MDTVLLYGERIAVALVLVGATGAAMGGRFGPWPVYTMFWVLVAIERGYARRSRK